ncbi:hypothetical protein Mnod_2205 [Methylobacterium nodulans ORS 2060]|uniref:Uncharacterized protein n=1 Tax=Methylobacterium nodulans (strain LMG 21967 / CNCM I-2342 / ORS 2060) TaxID=460265 RepID=B8I9V9_METNO|nr:hypothetical protein Mnod_2205 [Methylobacterium nodulans ORS 2060]
MSGYVKGFITEADAAARLPVIKAERANLEAELAHLADAGRLLTIESNVVAGYLNQVRDLAGTLSDYARGEDEASRRLIASFRGLIKSVTVLPGQPRRGIEVEVEGRLSALVSEARSDGLSGRSVVAEEGLEPPTQGL